MQDHIKTIRAAVLKANPKVADRVPPFAKSIAKKVWGTKHQDLYEPPVRLADVLLAIFRSSHWSEGWFITCDGSFFNLHEVGGGDKAYKDSSRRGYWNLKGDNLEHQSPETLLFIYNLLK